MNSFMIPLAILILLSGCCAALGQRRLVFSFTTLFPIVLIVGLSLGSLMSPAPINRIFLSGLFGYAAFSLIQGHTSGVRRTVSLVQLGIIAFLTILSPFLGTSFTSFASIFVAMSLLPIVLLHVPFVSVVSSAQGTLSGLWVVVFLALGLTEFVYIHQSIPAVIQSALPFLALFSAGIISLTCLGHYDIPHILAHAVVAHIALFWGLQPVFLDVIPWSLPFVMIVALALSGWLLAHDSIRQRYGWHALGQLPGLADPMPRLGVLVTLLTGITTMLPILPILWGVTSMPIINTLDAPIMVISLTILAIWLPGSWYFSRLLHHTMFGKARPHIPYTDLEVSEACSLVLIIMGAGFLGVFF